MTAEVRRLEGDRDDAAVRHIFRSTIALGRPLGAPPPALRTYEGLCLDWYLGAGRADARLLADGERVLGYALVCTDEDAYHRWSRRRALRAALRVVPAATTSRFWRLRLRDAATLRSSPRPVGAHAHSPWV
ncbi:MAG: hypothetical protein H0W25_02950 [Acidimicrobiia bacterium]|nr:hypothetical protein [Acidimicrobiia bacterium]